MNKNKKLISLLIILSLLLSFSFVCVSTSHELKCHETNCQLCEIIKSVESNSKTFINVSTISIILSLSILKIKMNFKSSNFHYKTLVSLKTRLDNWLILHKFLFMFIFDAKNY